MKKLLKTLVLLSAASLLLGGCKNKSSNGGSDSPVNPDPVNPDNPSKEFNGIPETLEDAGIFTFDKLERIEEEELDPAYETLFTQTSKLECNYEYYEDEKENLEEEFEYFRSTLNFYENDYLEVNNTYSEKYTFMGTNMTGWEEASVGTSSYVKIGNRLVACYQSTSLWENDYTSWYGENLSGDFREAMLFETGELYNIFTGAQILGKFTGKDGKNYVVKNSYNTDYSSASNYAGESFDYLWETFEQFILEIKDDKFVAISRYYESYVDKDLLTGEMLDKKVLREKALQTWVPTYGELTPNANRTAFVASIPQYGICYTGNISMGGTIQDATLDGSGNITGLTNNRNLSVSRTSEYVDPTHIKIDVKFSFVNTSENSSALRPYISATFSPLSESGSSKITSIYLVEAIGAALGAAGQVKTYNSNSYLILNKEVKQLSFTIELDFADVNMENMKLSNISISTTSDSYLLHQ